MTEAEWLACEDAEPMLDYLGDDCSERKARLFAVGCCRQIRPLLTRKASWNALEIAELFADGGATSRQLEVANRKARKAAAEMVWEAEIFSTLRKVAQRDAAAAASLVTSPSADPRAVLRCVRSAIAATSLALPRQADLLRELFGVLPFRKIEWVASWLSRGEHSALQIAKGIYDERAFDRLPILADALEEAGCDHADILDHCRKPGEHVRGCWVVDALLGKS